MTTKLLKPPKPGIYPDMPDSRYYRIDCASQSYLKLLAAGESPKEVRYQMLNPKPPTPEMRLGTALHVLTFEGREAFARKVVLCPPFNKRKPTERDAYAEFVEAHAEHTIIDTVEQWDRLHAMHEELQAHPFCREFLPKITRRELVILRVHAEHGLRSKCKLDAVIEEESIILDVKTAYSVTPAHRERTIRANGYVHQGGFYTKAAQDVGIDARHYVLLWVKTKPPYEVVPARLTETTLLIGRKQLAEPMATMAECYRSGRWPGQTDTLVDQSLSEWDERRAVRDLDLSDWESV